MPADAAAQPAAASPDIKPPLAVNPDRVGEELADDANIWHVYDRVAREDDDRRTKAWDTGLNNLALFAGLFSAVTTAFIIEAQQDLEPDYAQLTFLVLNATNSGERFVLQPFVVPSSARTVNCLWIASLVLSLCAALIAIMGKDWIGMYTARPVCNPRQWAEMRTYRLRCVDKWHMSGVIAAAPVLLHVSLLLFGAGLVVFISPDPLMHRLTLGLSLASGILYLVTALSAIVFSDSPFKSPATQMLRTAISVVFSHLRFVISLPKRDALRTHLQSCYSKAVAVGVRLTANAQFLPFWSGRSDQRAAHRPLSAILTAVGRSFVAYVRRSPTLLRTACMSLQWSRVRVRLGTIVSSVRQLPLNDWFVSSTWTDLPADRRPKLLADALSWLSGASQAPDVFRAIVFALGDLDFGPQVGEQTPLALRGRLRAHIRQTWQQADFLTLSRYVLADQNTPGDPALDYEQFYSRFDLSKEPGLRCEDGLAASIKLPPGFSTIGVEFESYLPSQITQPRMPEFLLPHIQKMAHGGVVKLVLVAHRYRAHLWRRGSFSFYSLEGHLYRSLDAINQRAYHAAVTGKYGQRSGVLELLTFLCDDDVIGDCAKPAAVELVMDILMSRHLHTPRERPCLAYLFGSKKLWDAAWKDKRWPEHALSRLSRRLADACQTVLFDPVRATNRQFNLALARTSVMLLSPQYEVHDGHWIKFLSLHLCESPSMLYDDERLDVIRLILDTAGLIKVLASYNDPGRIASCRTAILAAIIRGLGRRLRDPATIGDGEKLFALLARTQVDGPDGQTLTWDLAEWLRVQAPKIVEQYPCSTAPMQDVHEALATLYLLCQDNTELRILWDRIGYPGRPDDIFSDPFLDLGAFFASAERPLPAPGNMLDFLTVIQRAQIRRLRVPALMRGESVGR